MLELPEGWREQLPEEVRNSGVLDDVKSIDQMATMIVNARKLQSQQISIPGEDVASEKREAFLLDLQKKIPDLVYVGEGADMNHIYDRMGRPKEPTEYELPDIPDPLKDNFAHLTDKAHELGVTKGQMKGLSESILKDFEDNTAKQRSYMEDIKKGIETEFGEAADEKLINAAEFARKVGFDDKLVKAIEEGSVGAGNIKALDKLMEGFRNSGPRIGDDHGGNDLDRLTPEQAEMKINEIHNNKEHPYWDGSSPAHNAAVKKMVELTRAADAGKKKTETEEFRDALLGR